MEEISTAILTNGFLEAIRTWGQYKAGVRSWGWGPLTAKNLFSDYNLATPENPPSFDAVAGLEKIRINSTSLTTPKSRQALDPQVGAAVKYIMQEMNVQLVNNGGIKPGTIVENFSDAVGSTIAQAATPDYVPPPGPPPPLQANYWDAEAQRAVYDVPEGKPALAELSNSTPTTEAELVTQFGDFRETPHEGV